MIKIQHELNENKNKIKQPNNVFSNKDSFIYEKNKLIKNQQKRFMLIVYMINLPNETHVSNTETKRIDGLQIHFVCMYVC